MRSSVDVHNHLVEREVQHELFTVAGRLRTPERLAAVLELPPEQVGRVAVFETDKGPVAALVSSDRTPDPERIRKAMRAKEIAAATPRKASQLTDFISEAIPPVGLPKGFRVLMDRPLAEQEVVYFYGGDPAAVLKLRGEDLARSAEAKVLDLS
jgi:prolyl-tRNA editing enzyme YbaK/EbsC (Cys-tRNA(Pro) deacylase)